MRGIDCTTRDDVSGSDGWRVLVLAFIFPSLLFGDGVSPVAFNVATPDQERSVASRSGDFVFPSDFK